MLSKVLKGGEALAAQAMIFAPVHASPQPYRAAPAEGGLTAEERAGLTAKIRKLETDLTAARQESFDSGRLQGEQDAQAAMAPLVARLNASIAEIAELRPELRRRAEKDAVDLAMRIAERVLHRELSIDPNALNALARVVFDRLSRTEAWTLTVHPQFAGAIRGALPAGSSGKMRIEEDSSCAPGTLRIRCEDGAMDASVDSQLAEIGRGLTDKLTGK